MTIAGDIRTLLLTLDAVTALVGTGADARIRPERLQQDDDESEEAIIIEVDDIDHLNDLLGQGGRVIVDVTLRCRASTQALAEALAEAVRVNGTDPGTGMAGYKGTVNGHTFDSWLEDEEISPVYNEDGTDTGMTDVFANYMVSVAETI